MARTPFTNKNRRHDPGQSRTTVPGAGYLKVQMVKGGPWVAARIEYGPPNDPETGEPMDRSWRYRVTLDGREYDPSFSPTEMIYRIWEWGLFIPEEEYRLMLAQAEWDRQHDPDAPSTRPTEKIDISKLKPPF